VTAATLGVADAPVTIKLYADFQCPACKLFVTTELPRLLTDFVRPGVLRIEAHDIDILGRGAQSESLELAAGAACAAEQDLYWPFHDLVFWNQGRENHGDHDAAFIAGVASAAGLDRPAFDACVAGADVRSPVERETAAAVASGIASTPTLIVNDQRIVGVPEYEQLAALIRHLAAAGSGIVPAP
jgi:protein-disulfide isomerase